MSSDFLDGAAAIGRRIAADAVWHDGRCAWVGVVTDRESSSLAEYRVLGPSVYDGTAGVGLYLAELAAVTGDTAMRRTAIGAGRHALTDGPSGRRDGFHTGSLGIAWAVGRAAALLDDDELRARAREHAGRAAPDPGDGPDVLRGDAGSLLALVALADLIDEPALMARAVELGERLLALATVGRRGWSWPTREFPRQLCGLSHGAAGIGWALLELFTMTGDERFRAGAEGAFAYERSWLHEESGTWPDLRLGTRRRGAPHLRSAIVGSWCHGEAGIALTRLRAKDVIGPDRYKPEARIALETTRRVLAAAVRYEIDDLTLCHGAAGAADALMCGGEFEEPTELGHVALERYGASGRWPCEPLGGTTPALFRGTAGIGWWLLRLYDPAIRSPLALPMWLTAPVTAT